MRVPHHAAAIVLLAAALATGTATAADTAAGTASLVTTLRQSPPESKEQFLLRVGAWMADRQAETGHESCGSICQTSGGELAVMLFTSQRSHWCRMNFACPLSHPHMTAETIHSHPVSPGGGSFSRSDYRLGPGYLVRGRRMYYQNGPGTAAPFPAPEPRDCNSLRCAGNR